MTVEKFMIRQVITASPEDTIESVVITLDKHRIKWLPIIDKNNKFLGCFSTKHIVSLMLPKSATAEGGLVGLNFAKGLDEDIQEKMKQIKQEPVSNYMNQPSKTLNAEQSSYEGLLMLYRHGSPLPVLSDDGETLIGILTEQSAIEKFKQT